MLELWTKLPGESAMKAEPRSVHDLHDRLLDLTAALRHNPSADHSTAVLYNQIIYQLFHTICESVQFSNCAARFC